MKSCVICKSDIEESWYYPNAICDNCRETNKEVLDFTKEPEKFKSEITSIFYMTVGDFDSIFPQEREFLFNRWGLQNYPSVEDEKK